MFSRNKYRKFLTADYPYQAKVGSGCGLSLIRDGGTGCHEPLKHDFILFMLNLQPLKLWGNCEGLTIAPTPLKRGVTSWA